MRTSFNPRIDENSVTCPRCKAENKPIAKYCTNCGLPFSIETALKDEEERSKYDELMSKLMENEKVRESIKEALKYMSLISA